MPPKTDKPKAGKTDAVFIRKSSREQNEGGQVANVEAMLRALGCTCLKTSGS